MGKAARWFCLTALLICFPGPGLMAGEGKSADESSVVGEIQRLARQMESAVARKDRVRTVAVAEFGAGSPEAKEKKLGRVAADIFISTFLENRRITIVEREKIEELLKEQALQLSGVVNEKTAVKVGMLTGAQVIIVGSVSPVGNLYLITARAIEIESAKVIAAASVKVKREGLITLASRLLVTRKYASTAAFYSMVVPGWGQFYNDQPGKGTFLATAGGASLAGIVATSVLYSVYQRKYTDADNTEDAVDYREKGNDLVPWNWASIGAFATVWMYGVIDAYFEARSQLREAGERPGIKGVMVAPVLAASPPGQGYLGVSFGF